jgi:hypothetical protein
MTESGAKLLAMFLTMAAAAYAAIRWFFLGAIASKWIDLPQFAVQKREAQIASRNWGLSALALECITVALCLSIRKTRLQAGSNADMLSHWVFRVIYCAVGTVVMVFSYVLFVYLTAHR